MSNLFRMQPTYKHGTRGSAEYDIDADLSRHGWRDYMNAAHAEELLEGFPAYTYITYPRTYERGFTISFVNAYGVVEHHPFTLLSHVHGIWRNVSAANIGTLDQVVCMMMYGNKGQPL